MMDRTLCWELSEKIKRSVENAISTGKAGEIVGSSFLGGTTRYFDQLAESVVIDYIKTHGLHCDLISEEVGHLSYGHDFSIFLDPIDGSNNAISGLPFYCTSIGIFREGKEYGLVRNLAWDEWYEGHSEYGSFFNGKPIQTNPYSNMISLYTRKGKYIEELKILSSKFRCLGSVALEMCYVAKGSLLAFIDVRGKTRTTDIAASKVVLEQAGGLVTDEYGQPLDLDADHVNIVACLDHTYHKRIIDLLK